MKQLSRKSKIIILTVSIVAVLAVIATVILVCSILSSKDQSKEDPDNVTRYYEVSFQYPSNVSESEKAEISLPDSVTLAEGSLLYVVPIPERQGYIFSGWYYDGALTQLVSVEDTLTQNTVLYPLMTEGIGEDQTVDQQPMFVSALEVGEDYGITVKAKDEETLKKALFINAVSEGNVQKAAVATDNGDGTFTVVPEGGFVAGGTYQIKALDRFDQNVDEADYILFVQNGEVLSPNVKYFNVTVKREEYDRMRVDDHVQFVPLTATEGFDMDGTGLVSLTVGDNGIGTEQNKASGSFTYNGAALSVDDVVAIYDGELNEDNTVKSGNISYVKITAVSGKNYSYVIPGVEEILFIPDVLPIPESADLDASESVIKVETDILDYSDFYFNGEKYLDADTVADADDYVALYSGEFTEDSVSAYYKITRVKADGAYTVLTVEETTLESIHSSTGMYQKIGLDLSLSQNEITELSNTIMTQAYESGFDQETTKFFTQMLVASGNDVGTPNPSPLQLAVVDANGNDIPMAGVTPLVEVEAGVTALVIRLGHVDLEVELSNQLQEISTIRDGVGLRALLHVQVPLTIETVLNGTQVLDSLHLKLTATFEQEIAVDVDFWYDIDWAFIVPDDIEIGADFDLGTYTGVGATFTMSTAADYEADFDWDKFIKAFDSEYEPAKAKIASIAKTLEAMMDDPYEFFDADEGGNSLIRQYQEMLETDLEYVEILAVLLYKHAMHLDKFHIIHVQFMFEFTVSAKANISVGMSFEHKMVKRFSFFIDVFDTNATQNVTTLEDGYTNFNFYAMGNLGIRMGIRGTFKIGLIDVKWDNLGLMVEMGPYVDLYGFFFFHYDWYEDAETGKTEDNLRFAGAYYIEIGVYMDVDFFGGVLHDAVGFTIHLAEPEWPIWKSGDGWFACAPARPNWSVTISGRKAELPMSYYQMDMFGVKRVNVKTGEVYPTLYRPHNFEIVFSDPAFSYDHGAQKLIVTPPDETTLNLVGEMRITYKGAGLPLTNEPIVTVVRIVWKKTWPEITIAFHDYVYGDGYITTKTLYPKGSDQHGWQNVIQGETGEHIKYPDYTPPAGYDFKGWEDSDTGELFDPKQVIVEDRMIFLVPRLEARTDTLYTERHYIQSIDNPETYELYHEEKKQGRTGSLVDDDCVMDIEGFRYDSSKRPVYSIHKDALGEGLDYYLYGKSIQGDGSMVMEYYYTRDTYAVTLESTNTSLRWYNEEGYYVSWSYQLYGATMDTSAFIADIPGYTFRGWVDASTVDGASDAKNGTILDELPAVNGNMHYYAVYTPNTDIPYTVRHHVYTYSGMDTTFIREETCYGTADEKIDLDSLILDINYNRAFVTQNGYGVTELRVSPYGNMVIDVMYDVPYYRVSWSGYGYNETVYDMLFEGETITPPETPPTKEGYTFSHWEGYTEGMTMGTESVTMTPVFIGNEGIKYTVVHAREDQESRYDNEEFIETEILEGRAGAEVTPEVRSYEGFDSPAAQTVTVAADGSLVVTYRYTRSAYRLTLKSEDREDDVRVYRYGLYRQLPTNYTRDGYTFVGWYLEGDETKTLQEYVDVNAMGDLTYVALWEKKGISYTVEYYLEGLDGGFTCNPVVLTGEIGEAYTAEVKDFPGFTHTPEAEGTVSTGRIVSENDTLVLKLYYTRNSYTVTWYDSDGVTRLGTSEVKFGEEIIAPTGLATPTREGYTFAGWSELGLMRADDTSVYAKDSGVWNAHSYTVVFSANGGLGVMTPQSFTYGESKALSTNTFTYKNRNFKGWSTSIGGAVAYDDGQAVGNLTAENGATVTLYAVWELVDGASVSYTVEYYLEDLGGSAYTKHGTVSTMYGEIGSTVNLTAANAIAIEGFTFDADNAGNLLSATLAEDGSTVLKMYYLRNSYDLTIDFGGEQIVVAQEKRDEDDWSTGMEIVNKEIADQIVSVPYGANISDYLPDTLTEIGYTFSGWSNANGTMPARDRTVTAQWTPVKVTVTFYPGTYWFFPDGYDFEANQVVKTYDYGSMVELPEEAGFVIDGYVMTGWIFGQTQGNYPHVDHFPLVLVEGYYYEYMPTFRVQATDEDGNLMYDDEYNPIYTDELAVTVSPFWSNAASADVVSFNGNGGSGSMADMYVESYGFRALPDCGFVYEGYTFVGWNTEPDGSGTSYTANQDFYGNSEYTSQATVLYAIWEKTSG